MNDAVATEDFADLRRFFAPASIAMIGATEDQSKFGGRCMKALMGFGFAGQIFPINPKRDTILGHRCYASIDDVPVVPDHVGIILPAHAIAGALEACGRRGVPFATIYSAGFTETGTDEGRRLQDELRATAQRTGIRFMGPNCNGLINYVHKVALTSTGLLNRAQPPAGDIAVVSQSGGAGQINTMWRAQEAGLGISYQVSSGNDADLDILDYANFMLESPETRVVLMLAEHIASGPRLRRLAQRAAAARKPIVMIKAGRTEAGSRAAASHTGAVTGSDAVFEAAMRQLGIIRAVDTPELYEAAMLLRRGRLPAGTGAAALSVSGGNLVMVADLGATLGLDFPPYEAATQARLTALLPGFSGARNPTDLTAAAIASATIYTDVARTLAQDAAVDTLVPIVTLAPKHDLEAIAALSEASAKPVALLWTGHCLDDASMVPATLVARGHAVYRDALPCLRAVAHAARYAAFLDRTATPERPAGIDRAAAIRLVRAAGASFSGAEAKALLGLYGLPFPAESLATSAEMAVQAAAAIDGPVVLKIESADIPHKTEAGGVMLNLRGAESVRAAHDAILASARAYKPDARIDGVLVQEMVQGGQEMLLGTVRDPTFGPVLVVGFGGIHVEVLRDVAFRLPAIDREEALAMLKDLRMFKLLEGVRGAPPADMEALLDTIVRMSWLAQDLGAEGLEIDVNPLVVLPQGRGVRALDALVLRA
ncbi:acetate--CoA ligase family protein [Humitalea sp. 24SJ18S-53]|uniref:acetate--CoA ligase family protein n=1 Tax=Humitalea sp. 24SJ18S-53 TaxID=3422307 RepID=UPI003D667BA3